MKRIRAVWRTLWKVPGAILCAAEWHDWRYRLTQKGLEWPWWKRGPFDTMRRCSRCHSFCVKNVDGDWKQVW